MFVELVSPELSLIASSEGQTTASTSVQFDSFVESDAGDYICLVVVSSPLVPDFNFTSFNVATIARTYSCLITIHGTYTTFISPCSCN